MSNVIEFRRGKPRKEETKRKISESLKGRKRGSRKTSTYVAGGLAGGAAIVGAGLLLSKRAGRKAGVPTKAGMSGGSSLLPGGAGKKLMVIPQAKSSRFTAAASKLGASLEPGGSVIPLGRSGALAARQKTALATTPTKSLVSQASSVIGGGKAMVTKSSIVVGNEKSMVTSAAQFVKVRGQAISDTGKAIKSGYKESTPTRVIQAGGALGRWAARGRDGLAKAYGAKR